jgi:hypothetical protein
MATAGNVATPLASDTLDDFAETATASTRSNASSLYQAIQQIRTPATDCVRMLLTYLLLDRALSNFLASRIRRRLVRLSG